MDRTCIRCGLTLDADEFYFMPQTGKKGNVWKCYDSRCKRCRALTAHEARKERKRLIVEYLGGACCDCGLVDDPIVYDCHHLDPTKKDFSIAKVSISFEKIKSEIDKCVLICANCHRKRHGQTAA